MFRTRVWLAALLAFSPATAFGQAKPKIETKDVSFDSADGVELQGTLYKSAKGGTSPVVMLLHSFGKDPNLGDWKVPPTPRKLGKAIAYSFPTGKCIQWY